ncbi:MAG: stage III sporulation protein SpoIIIAB [Bacillota bacterium]
MWLKLIAVCLTLASSTMIGWHVAQNYIERPRQLGQLRAALQLLETEISYAATPLPKAMRRVAASQSGPVELLFSQTASVLDARVGYSAREAWSMALQEFFQHSSLLVRDREILEQFGQNLGSSDRSDQLKHLRLVMVRLEQEEQQGQLDEQRNVRLWRYAGFLVGLMVVIVLI